MRWSGEAEYYNGDGEPTWQERHSARCHRASHEADGARTCATTWEEPVRTVLVGLQRLLGQRAQHGIASAWVDSSKTARA